MARARAPRRPTNWYGTVFHNQALSDVDGDGSVDIGLQTGQVHGTSNFGAPTIIRTIGLIIVSSEVTDNELGASFGVHFGLAAVHEALSAAELNPWDHPESDHWLWLGYCRGSYGSVQIPVRDEDANQVLKYDGFMPYFGDDARIERFDVRSMRRLQDERTDYQLRFHAQSTNISTIHISGYIRTLVKV